MNSTHAPVARKFTTLFIALVTACGALQAGTVRQGQGYVPEYTVTELGNGLRVVLHRDTTVPLVSVNIAYRAGSSRDPRGKTGTAHIAGQLFPSLTSVVRPADFARLRRDLQAGFSAQTGVDWTSISSIVPSTFLDSALHIEADRMKHGVSFLDTSVFIDVRDRVRAETAKRLGSPLGKVDMELYHMLYPEGHPYRHLSTGEKSDLDSIRYDDVRDFLARYYCPANATLTLAGSFDTLQAAALIDRYFASIPAGIRSQWKVSSKDVPPVDKVGFISEEYIGYERLMLVFPTVPATHPDDPKLKLIGSALAGGSRAALTSVLKRRPDVYTVEAYQSSQELAGEFWISVTCQVNTDLTGIYSEVMAELKRLGKEALSAQELQAAKNATELYFLLPLENIHGFGGRADQLNLSALMTGNPAFTFQAAAARQVLSTSDLRPLFRQYFSGDNVVIASIVPAGKSEHAATF